MGISPALRELTRPGRSPLGQPVHADFGVAEGPIGELAELLSHTNGFTAAETGVQVFRFHTSGLGPELREWNAPDTWRDTYGSLTDGLFFFGHDLFGVQFAIEANDRVVTFDPETAGRATVGHGLDDWARWLLSDLDRHGARGFAREWQHRNGPLGYSDRLVPRRFFVLGGTYDDDNLAARNAVQGMRVRGPVAQHLHDLPDGTTVRLQLGP